MESASSPNHLDGDLILGLDPERIVDTISKLERRIGERFPGANLSKVCGHLAGIAEQTVSRLDQVAKPILWLRAGSWMMAGLVVVGTELAAANFGVVEPEVTGLLPLHDFVHIRTHLGYRIVYGVEDLPQVEPEHLRGATLTLSLSLGPF